MEGDAVSGGKFPAQSSASAGSGHRDRPGWTWLALLAAVGVVIALGSLARRSFYGPRPAAVYALAGSAMGTTWSARLVLPEGMSAPFLQAVRESVESRLRQVDSLMSTWDSTSELSRFNRHRSREPFPVSPHTVAVFAAAHAVSEASGGALDVTVGGLVDAWGFGPGAPGSDRPEIPSDEEVARLRRAAGWNKISIDSAAGFLRKVDPHTVADLSAVAKGYAVDRVAAGLTSLGVEGFAFELGGEVITRGRRPDGAKWKVGLEAPEPGVRRIYRTAELEDEAIATSGDYRSYYELDGVRYAHIIDPRTGRPLPLTGFSVSVVHRRAALADAWATALCVLGPEEGLRIADRYRLPVAFVDGMEGRPVLRLSEAMRTRLAD